MTPPAPGTPPPGRPRHDAPWNAPEHARRPRADRPGSGSSAGRGTRERARARARTDPAEPRRPAPPRSEGRRPRPAGTDRSRPTTGTGRAAAPTRQGPSRQGPSRPAPSRQGPSLGARIAGAVGHAATAADQARARHRTAVAARRSVGAATRRPVDHRRRLLVLLAVLASLFVLLGSKVVDLQVLNPGRYQSFGEAQRVDTQVLGAERGSILDRNGDELAVSRPTRSIFVDPGMVEDPATAAAVVAPLLGEPVEEVQAAMTGDGRFAYLVRRAPAEVADQVEALALPGVGFLDDSERYLPAGDSARALLGAVDVDGNGISGLEEGYDAQLKGVPGTLTIERNPEGATIAVGEHHVEPAVPGQDLTLTVDRAIQYEAEAALVDQVSATEAAGGTAIVTVPGTGEILAMASVVTDPTTGEVVVGTNNAALTTQYEPGSVMKMVTFAAAMEAGTVDPTTRFYLPPTLKIYDDVFGEAEPRGAVSWDVAKILEQSSNIGTIKVAETVDDETLYDVQRRFGFGEATRLGFPNEAAGAVREPSTWSGTSKPTIAIGQGISVTPLQMLLAYNVVANQGLYVPPTLLKSSTDAEGVDHPMPLGQGRRVVSQSTADQLNVMLRSVVEGGTGQLAKIDGYHVFGKTGTARKAQRGGYLDENGLVQYQSTFIGVVPAEQPALSVYVMIDEPGGGQYTGGTTAAPAFSRIASFALRRLGIPPAATDQAEGGAPVQGDGGVPTGVAIVADDGRVRAPVAGAPTTTPSTVPHGGSTESAAGGTG